ncbi:HIT family protein [Microbaculum marinum]|uniref:HIT family protein n=1 Tax=Microbaculum marinum TaxID=1764581 RepID=A0AAW9RYU5_9HYPH
MPAYDDDNIFARILRGEIPCFKVYEDDRTFAFLDIMPRSKGHMLVIPKVKATGLTDIGADDLSYLMGVVQKLAPKLTDALGADGFMIQQFNGEAAGQTVFHLHFHIIPRWADVPLKPHGRTMEDKDVLAATAETVKAAFAA